MEWLTSLTVSPNSVVFTVDTDSTTLVTRGKINGHVKTTLNGVTVTITLYKNKEIVINTWKDFANKAVQKADKYTIPHYLSKKDT